MAGVFQCSVCTQRYDHGGRLPKVLTCGHTFCLRCVNKCKPQCPVCRRKWGPETTGNPFDLETNYQIFEWLEEEEGDTSEASEWSDSDGDQYSDDDDDVGKTKECTIFVQWVPSHFTYREVKDAFSHFGRVHWVRVAGCHEDGRRRSWAHVTFASAAATSRALDAKYVQAACGARLPYRASGFSGRGALGASRRAPPWGRRRAHSADSLDDFEDVRRHQEKSRGVRLSKSTDSLDVASHRAAGHSRHRSRPAKRLTPSPPPFSKQLKSLPTTSKLTQEPEKQRLKTSKTIQTATKRSSQQDVPSTSSMPQAGLPATDTADTQSAGRRHRFVPGV
ncbi:uncharacterized protein LOC117642662 [Thrips palmi]|uniref:Uncharacterized protein LOC117642662 n=1 Tax=Thrips palmi TaxID=161013 RepID=A0A6P8YBH9_THRPL|nr:uncharacterized protein LOC117642662 [Thrips palmi]